MTKEFIIKQFLEVMSFISKDVMNDEDSELLCPGISENDCISNCRHCWRKALEKELKQIS